MNTEWDDELKKISEDAQTLSSSLPTDNSTPQQIKGCCDLIQRLTQRVNSIFSGLHGKDLST